MATDAGRDRFAELRGVVEAPPAGRWLVLTHDNPDPDALASAALLERLLVEVFKQRVTVAYGGIVGRAENREMVKALGLELVHVRGVDFGRFRRFALVDTQPRTGNNQLPDPLVPDVVFDHHPLRKASLRARFYDIRPKHGATATILSEHLLAAGLRPSRALATALVYAIRSETQDFSREFAPADKATYDAFLTEINQRALGRIQNARLPLAYLRNLHDALENLETVSNLVVSHLGPVDHPDIVPEVADLLLRLEGKTWSLATGLYGGRIYLSIRTTNGRADAGRVMRALLGRRGKGGGHGMMAGGWVDAAKLPDGDPKALQKQLGQRLAALLRRNPEKLARVELKRRDEESGPAA
ncbi:MAG TPA: DHHA1 domain-containing protein [Thermoanaerobaculia bacterium]|nr:DHHA1 domain-containing protein [Thermoanaerobaculia bacterium]